jgi:hypothetical protein
MHTALDGIPYIGDEVAPAAAPGLELSAVNMSLSSEF